MKNINILSRNQFTDYLNSKCELKNEFIKIIQNIQDVSKIRDWLSDYLDDLNNQKNESIKSK